MDHLDKLRKIVSALRVPIGVIQTQPDLDGTGGTYGKAEILRHLGAEAYPVFCGAFDDPQNIHVRKMMELDRDMIHVSKMPADWMVALVDSCRLDDKRFGIEIDPRRIVSIDDHHIPDVDPSAPERFVSLTVNGSVCTQILEQAQALGTALTERTCTLMTLGIHSDTSKFRSPATTDADCMAFAELRARSDKAALQSCFNYPLPPRYYDLAAKTYARRRLIGPTVVSHPNRRMHLEESGFISRYADRFLQLKGSKVAVVWCLTETQARFSFRTEHYDFDLRPLIDHVCGKGNGGAKHCSGGAQVPLTELPLDGCAFDDEKIRRIESLVHERIASYFETAPR